MNRRKRSCRDKTLDALAGLLDAAMRAELHFGRDGGPDGTDFGGEPLDDSVWWELRRACLRAKYALKAEGASGRSYRATKDLPGPVVVRKGKKG